MLTESKNTETFFVLNEFSRKFDTTLKKIVVR